MKKSICSIKKVILKALMFSVLFLFPLNGSFCYAMVNGAGRQNLYSQNLMLITVMCCVILILLICLVFLVNKLLKTKKIINKNMENEKILNGLVNTVVYKIMPDGIETLYYSDGVPKLLDMTKDEYDNWVSDGDLIEKCVYKGDLPRFMRMYERVLNNKYPNMNINFRLNTKNNVHTWIHLNAFRIREENGYPVFAALFSEGSDEAKMYRKIIDDSPTGVFVASVSNDEILYANSAMYRLGLCDSGEILGRNCYEVFFGRRERCEFCRKENLSYNSLLVCELFNRDMTRHYCNSARLIDWNGIPAYIEYISEDTESFFAYKKRNDLINNFPGGAGICEMEDGKFRVSFLNEGYYKMLGRNMEDSMSIEKNHSLNYIYPDDKKKILSEIASLNECGQIGECTVHVETSEPGVLKWINMRGTLSEKDGDKKVFYVSFSDVDESKKASIKLNEAYKNLELSEKMLNEAIRHSEIKLWEYFPETGCVVWTSPFENDFDAENIMENYPDSWIEMNITAPESVEDLKRFYNEAKAGKTEGTCEIKNKFKDGYRWERLNFTSIPGKGEERTKVIVTAIDITKQKEAEKRFEEELARKSALEADSVSSITYNVSKDTIAEAVTNNGHRNIIKQNCRLSDAVSGMYEFMASDKDIEICKKEFNQTTMLNNYYNDCRKYEVVYCITPPDGKDRIKYYSADISMAEDPRSKEIYAFVYTHDVTDDILKKEVIESAIEEEVDFISYLNLKTNIVKMLNYKKDAVALPGTEPRDYTESNMVNIPAMIPPEEQEECFKAFDVENIKKELINKDEFSIIHSVYNKRNPNEKRRVKHRIYYLNERCDIIVFVRSDITDVFNQEQEKNRQLQDALRQAKQANAAKSDFLSRMSHEIRTPMNAVLSLASLGAEDSKDPEMTEYFKKINDSGKYLLGLINDILDMSRIERQKVKLNPEIAELDKFFSTIMSIIKPLYQAKNIDFVFDRSEFKRKYAKIDVMRTQQILINLLNNAIKFSDNGGRIEFTALSLNRGGKEYNKFIIRDYGVGMSKDFLSRVFNPFEQEQNKFSSSQEGTGLGLAISKNLVSLMGGTIEVESVINQGSTFTVEIPVSEPGAEEIREFIDLKRDSKNTCDLSGRRVLLAEDHPINTEITVKLLEKRGMVVEHAEDGVIAVDMFKKSKPGYYDAVLMDIRMPNMDGLEAAEKIRSLNRSDAKTVPIIAMTANAFDTDIENSINAGMNAHLSKPIKPEEVYKTLEILVGRV